jgi:hypothetical protein
VGAAHPAPLGPRHQNGSAQLATLLMRRGAVIVTALMLAWNGEATPGDVAYVLTAYFVIHGYLHDIGIHVRNLQRSVNDMEELVTLDAEPLGVRDRIGAPPVRITRGEVRFDRVGFRYGARQQPLFRDLSLTIRAGERGGLVGHSGSGKTTFVKLRTGDRHRPPAVHGARARPHSGVRRRPGGGRGRSRASDRPLRRHLPPPVRAPGPGADAGEVT